MRVFASMMTFAFFLSGCAPGHLMVREGDLQALEQRIDEQEQRMELLANKQASMQSALLASQEEVLRALQAVSTQQAELYTRQREWESFIRSTRLQVKDSENTELFEVQLEPFATVNADKQVVGSIENVYLAPPGIVLPARIDTGATTSSLDARHVQRFERNGERWVRFTIVNPDDDSEIVLERKIVRNVRIIQAIQDEAERRPVVELGVTVGKTTQTAQFTLSDRQHLEFPILIGRNILMDIMVVDVAQTNIAPPVLPVELTVPGEAP